MRRITLIFFLVFLLFFQASLATAQPWHPDKAPHDRELARLLHGWINANKSEFCGEFKPDEQELLDDLVTGTLIWVNANGDRFDATAFLALFPEKDDSIRWCIFPSGGMIFVLESSFLRIARDIFMPGSLQPDQETETVGNGRWYVAFGSGNRTTLLYFSTVEPVWEDRLTY